jgi:hypothetical protein
VTNGHGPLLRQRPACYVLAEDGRTPVPATLMEGSKLLENVGARRVALTHLGRAGWVSTVFLVIDHGIINGKPVLFETMVFGGWLDGFQVRATSYAKAWGDHWKAVRMVRALMQPMAKKLYGHFVLGHRYMHGSNDPRYGGM